MFSFSVAPSRMDAQRRKLDRIRSKRKRRQREAGLLPQKQQQQEKAPTSSPAASIDSDIQIDQSRLSLDKRRIPRTISSVVSNDDDSEFGTGSESFRRSSQSMGTGSSSLSSILVPTRITIFTGLIAIVGLVTSTLFMGFGISGAVREQELRFHLHAEEMISAMQESFKDYEIAAKWVHKACRSNEITREGFREVYEYLTFDGLDVQAIQWASNITHDKRAELELEASEFYETNYPDFEYRGIVGFEDSEQSIQPRSEQPFYFPYHLVEPVEGNLPAIDFDIFSSPQRRQVAELALSSWQPAISHQASLIQDDPNIDTVDRRVTIMHPGIPLSNEPDLRPQDLAVLLVGIDAIVKRASRKLSESLSLYIYDTTNSNMADFLYAAEVHVVDSFSNTAANLTKLPEMDLDELEETTVVFYDEDTIELASQTWTVSVVALEDTFQPNLIFIIVTGKFILIATLCLSLWIYTSMRRNTIIGALKRETEAEKARLYVANAKQAAKTEQELNDYIAHEVRNPVAAALSACTFVKAEISEKEPMRTEKSIQSVREDFHIIDSSLRFINDLLRNMLDMHRAASKKLNVELVPMDIRQDILDPVGAMLYQRDLGFEVIIECPQNLVVMTDRLRLKQIMLNLGRNSAKFVERGFVRLGAEVIDNEVIVFVEDSGPGINEEKKQNLFSKFQESLDVLDQGTGIGLSLCKSMVGLLGGTIILDNEYDSGVEGCPGSKFIIYLKVAPLDTSEYEEKLGGAAIGEGSERGEGTPEASDDSNDSTAVLEEERQSLLQIPSQELPEELSVLFVDDDMILRKLFARSVRNVAPGWKIQEAANGERAIQMIEEGNAFDIIFLDQYMSSVEKQMLGTETARALRALGVQSVICGLSANDVEQGFLLNGANFFMFKPLPCDKDGLRTSLRNLLYKSPPEDKDASENPNQMIVRFGANVNISDA